MSLYSIEKTSSYQFTDKGSKFIAHINPVENIDTYKNMISVYKIQNPKSSHVCTAYRIHVGSDIVEYSSDDGEPRGSAGKPILNVLKRNNLVNVAAYVVRYFGGRKLGIPGLINAYEVSTMLAIEKLDIVEWEKYEKIKIIFSYSNGSIVDFLLEKYRAIIIDNIFSNTVRITLKIPSVHIRAFRNEIKDRLSGKIDIK